VKSSDCEQLVKSKWTRKSEVVNELYLLIHNTLKTDYHKIARSITEGVNEADVEAGYADAFMNCLEKFQGGNFTNLLSMSLKNKRADLSKINRRRTNRFQMEKSDKNDDKSTIMSFIEYANSTKNLNYSLDDEVVEKPVSDETRREIIAYLLEQADDEKTEQIITEWLKQGENYKSLYNYQIVNIDYKAANRRIKKLRTYYGDAAMDEFGYIEKYLATKNN
jgi:hypothetical protein